jgi:hypothetical protein
MAAKFGLVAPNIGGWFLYLTDKRLSGAGDFLKTSLSMRSTDIDFYTYPSHWRNMGTTFMVILEKENPLFVFAHPSGARKFEIVCRYVDSLSARGIR